MFGTKRKGKPNWFVMCKACGRPFATGHDRESADDLPSSAEYQCTFCGMTSTYSVQEHAPAR
ncbi:MAG TPA: hypothetical protein VGB64_00160 [Actinomycetota bacterium]